MIFVVVEAGQNTISALTVDPVVARNYQQAGAVVLNWPQNTDPTVVVLQLNVNTGKGPQLVAVSPTLFPTSSSTTATHSATASAVVSGGTTAA